MDKFINKVSKNDTLFILALVFAIWFASTGVFWIYWFALYISYPFGITSFFIWQNIRKDDKKRNRIIPIILIIGLALSVVPLAWMYIQRSITP